MAKASSALHGRQPAKCSAWNSFINLEWQAVNDSLWKLQSPDKDLRGGVQLFILIFAANQKMHDCVIMTGHEAQQIAITSQTTEFIPHSDLRVTSLLINNMVSTSNSLDSFLKINSVSGNSSIGPPTTKIVLLNSLLQFSRLSQACKAPSSGHNCSLEA